jgi:hypothetical protein
VSIPFLENLEGPRDIKRLKPPPAVTIITGMGNLIFSGNVLLSNVNAARVDDRLVIQFGDVVELLEYSSITNDRSWAVSLVSSTSGQELVMDPGSHIENNNGAKITIVDTRNA